MTDETTEAVARAVAAERARCAARVVDEGRRYGGLKSTPTLRAVSAALGGALHGIESGDTGADPDVVLTVVARLTRELDETRAAIRADLRCDECGAVATKRWVGPPDAGASHACDGCSDSPSAPARFWTDLPHAAAVRAAMVTP